MLKPLAAYFSPCRDTRYVLIDKFNFFFILYTQAFTVLKFGPLMTILGCF